MEEANRVTAYLKVTAEFYDPEATPETVRACVEQDLEDAGYEVEVVPFAKDNNVPGKWISVKDRLPDNEDITYMGIVSGTVIEGCAIVHLDKSIEFVNWENSSGFYMPDYPEDKISVSHWMELPDVPEDIMRKIYVSMVDISVPLYDDDGHAVEGKQSVVETGSLWVITKNSVIGGEVHLEESGRPWHWIEISKELFEACFQEEP